MTKEITNYNTPYGLYLHIPFCTGKCRYCDFYSINYSSEKMQHFLQQLTTEINLYSDLLTEKRLLTIYFGGGTPGLLTVKELEELLETVFQKFSYPETGEITLEANPCSLDEETIRGFRNAGITRLSLGIQSFQDSELVFLGRRHSMIQAEKVIELVNRYFDNYNLDLIFAIPGQSIGDWLQTLERALFFAPPHLSLYNLQIEKETELGFLLDQGKIEEFSEEMDAEMYLKARDLLKNNGYEQYEISNFSKPGFSSRHNLIYWKYKPYLGLGPSAHSFNGLWRFNNPADIELYRSKIQSFELPIINANPLFLKDQMAEYLFMGLRLMEGVSINDFYRRFRKDIMEIYDHQINTLQEAGLIEVVKGMIKLTDRGILLANQVFMEFLPG